MKDPRNARFAVVRSRFNDPLTKALLEGALQAFRDAGIAQEDVACVEVPGAFELPVAALWLARSNQYDAVLCLGCVIRGETPHFEYVAGTAARGICEVSLATAVPVIFGVLTTENEEQAWARASAAARTTPQHGGGSQPGNKGFEAARAALEMVALRRALAEQAVAIAPASAHTSSAHERT